MTEYQLPKPAIHAPFYKEYRTVYPGDYYTTDQLQQAYRDGREAMRQECVQVRKRLSELWPDEGGDARGCLHEIKEIK